MLYVGGFRNDEFHGEGTLTYPDGRLYEGQFSNGEFHGKGKEVFADGKQYEGQYIEGSFHGKGLLSNPNGSSIQATFRYGEPYGKVRRRGIYRPDNGARRLLSGQELQGDPMSYTGRLVSQQAPAR